jgi:DNA-binding FrmR family transcriptional regulator
MHHKLKTEDINKRLNKAIGQINGLKKMIDGERDCPEVLIQIAAVRSALAKLGLLITEDHIEHCVIDSFKTGKGEESIASLSNALKQMLK